MIFAALYVLLHTLRNKNIYQFLFLPTFNYLVHAADSHAYFLILIHLQTANTALIQPQILPSLPKVQTLLLKDLEIKNN
jgi:hypothetical protein